MKRKVAAVKVAVLLCVTLSATFIARARHGVEHGELSPRRVIPTTPYIVAASGLGLVLGVLFPHMLEIFRKMELTEEDESNGGAPVVPINDVDNADESSLSCTPSTVVVNCLGGRFFHMPVTETTTIMDLFDDVFDLLEVSGRDEFGLVFGLMARRVHAHRADTLFNPSCLVHGILSDWADATPPLTDEMEIVFNIIAVDKVPVSIDALMPPNSDFLFANACDMVLRRRFLVVETELISLAALQALAVLGDPPASVLATRRLPALPMLHPSFVDGLALVPAPGLPSNGTFVVASPEKIEQIHQQIIAAWQGLKGVATANEARRHYYSKVSKWPRFEAELGVHR